MNKAMQIKIISGKGKWYEKHIGKTYHVKCIRYAQSGDCFVIRNYRTILRMVAFDDAEIMKQPNVKEKFSWSSYWNDPVKKSNLK